MESDPIMEVTKGADEFEKAVKDNLGLPEAPASATVRVYIDDFSTLITVRGTEAADVVRKIDFIITYAKKKGWKSTWNKDTPPPPSTRSPVPRSTAPKQAPTYEADAPFCPTHNRPMKKFNGRYGEFWKCTAKLGEGQWCSEKVNIK